MNRAILLSTLSLALASTSAWADQCAATNTITIESSGNGSAIITPPPGFTFAGYANSPVTITGPVTFESATVESQINKSGPAPYVGTKFDSDVTCTYGVGRYSKTGGYSGGVFSLTKDNSHGSTYDLSYSWLNGHSDGFPGYVCPSIYNAHAPASCSFTLSAESVGPSPFLKQR